MSYHNNTPLEILLADKPRERVFATDRRVRSLGPKRSEQLQPADDTENYLMNRAQRRKNNGVNSNSFSRTIAVRLYQEMVVRRQAQKRLQELLAQAVALEAGQ